MRQDKNSFFAVKEFKDRPLHTGSDFAKELKILDELRKYPHDHIVTHLATWTQDGRYYMLFAYAECNMRDYMSRNKFSQPTKRNILWLLRQFLGLSNALRQIHNLSESGVASQTTANLSASRQDIRKSGWHHDLKPENILYFKSPGSQYGSFQIADFGSGKVHTYRSGSVNTRSPNGTLTYEPPEAAKEGATSRPYDMWSMGCVFLELLIWAFFGYSSVKTFETNRMDRRFPGSATDIIRDDGFWQIDTEGIIHFRASVEEWLVTLDQELRHQGHHPFLQVFDLVKDGMLDKERQTRISALDLWDTLNRIHIQAKIDLQNVKNDAVPEKRTREADQRNLPRLSIKAPDRRILELTSPVTNQKLDIDTSHTRRTPMYGANLMASPQAASFSGRHRRDSSGSGYSERSDIPMRDRSGSNASSTHAQGGSSIRSDKSQPQNT